MKHLARLLCVLLFAGCGSEDRPEPERILNIEAFDVGNAGNSSDIRVRFEVDNIAGINEFKMVIVPVAASDNFTTRDALVLGSESFHTVNVNATDSKFSERLPAITDVSGDPVIDGIEYVIRILVVGSGFQHISLVSSNALTLTDEGIYNGFYEGNVVQYAGNDLNFEFTLRGTSGGTSYSGPCILAQKGFEVIIVWEGSVSFSITGNKIESQVWNLPTLGQPAVDCNLDPSIGYGFVVRDLTFETITEDCNEPNVVMTVTRRIPE